MSNKSKLYSTGGTVSLPTNLAPKSFIKFFNAKYEDIEIYRFFKQPSQADALCSGDVWLSTLETCRGYENAEQGDKGEAIHTHTLQDEIIDSDIKRKELLATYSIADESMGTRVVNRKSYKRVPDGFVICTSMEYNKDKMKDAFGQHCVKIHNPAAFFESITNKILSEYSVPACDYMPIHYSTRNFIDFEKPPAPIGFVKPKEIYGDQKEFRFIWIVNANAIQPKLIKVPAVAKLCTRIA